MALFDAESALEQLPPKEEGEEGNEANEGADDEMQWRELCTSIARRRRRREGDAARGAQHGARRA
jgi:hypothetical protein